MHCTIPASSLLSIVTNNQDWKNLLERLRPKLGGLDPRHVTDADFDVGGPLAHAQMELLLWASYRGQLLARTVRGMMAYDKVRGGRGSMVAVGQDRPGRCAASLRALPNSPTACPAPAPARRPSACWRTWSARSRRA